MTSGSGPLPEHERPPSAASPTTTVPLTARLAVEIPKPRDWQALQRNCVLLFRAELGDPNTQEYGRSGQNQGGIDILGRRGGDPDHYVGIQVRLVVPPLKHEKILSDCRAALALEAQLKEIIFATTAPDDAKATDAAVAVERLLREEGHDLSVSLYGWGNLQTLIAVHEVAYAAFVPSSMGSSVNRTVETASVDDELAGQIAAKVAELIRAPQTAVVAVSAPRPHLDRDTAEDPALHARIDTWRDLFRDGDQPGLAETGLRTLLNAGGLEDRPWALYRIHTNLASVLMDLGREKESVAHFEAAYAIRPDDGAAVANLALARTIEGRYVEAMDLARQALAATPREDSAIGYLLQAAGRTDWDGDPESLIPDDLNGSESADIGLAEFLRRREPTGWARQVLEIARRHPDSDPLKRGAALAVLTLATEGGGYFPGANGLVLREDVDRAAEDMRALADHCLTVGFADDHDLTAHLHNAALLLRLADRAADAEALISRGLTRLPGDSGLRRFLALAQAADGRRTEAVATLLPLTDDVEAALLRLEITGAESPEAGLAEARAFDASALTSPSDALFWQILGEFAARVGDAAALREAAASLRSLRAEPQIADLMSIQADQLDGIDPAACRNRLATLAQDLPDDVPMSVRYIVANHLRGEDMDADAADLLAAHVDLQRGGPATILYLQSLANARRDDAFIAALAAAGEAVRHSPVILWAEAAHAWNLGDLRRADDAVDRLLARQPDDRSARLLKIEILMRQDRSTALLDALDKPIESLPGSRVSDLYRIAALLGNFGYYERAAALAYRLFLEHRDQSRAWMTLSALVIEEGRGEAGKALWTVETAGPDSGIDVTFADGETVFFIIEPDVGLRRLDPESWEPTHPLVQAVSGLHAGKPFEVAGGRAGVVSRVRHKYVARLHYVMENHEQRFPAIFGFRAIHIDPDHPKGLDELKALLKQRHDWFDEEQQRYYATPSPLGVLAHRLGLDTIDVAQSLTAQGLKLKVAQGTEDEREAAAAAIVRHGGAGCVLDLQTFWTAWRLGALEVVVETVGAIHVPQSVVDRLQARRERFARAAQEGLLTASWRDDTIAVVETAAEALEAAHADVEGALAWIAAHAVVCPMVATEGLAPALRDQLITGKSDVFDTLVITAQRNLLLVNDDLVIRGLAEALGQPVGAWLHQVLAAAVKRRLLAFDVYVRWSADLIDAGQRHVSVSGDVLAAALRIDAAAGTAPGPVFSHILGVIGGAAADPISHLGACTSALKVIWNTAALSGCREAATGMLVTAVIRERKDYVKMLGTLLAWTRDEPGLRDYLLGWIRGHFLYEDLMRASRPAGRSAK